ncbi:hypothetical protein CRENBAI_010394 [Crenichthys baileyi]|uniref:Uncharacterized protein n=1 Tax=Crenichthys baileyi TaxID=28760 RepID=A0AAV9QUL2_9TELE
MLPPHLHPGVQYLASRNRMIPPRMNLFTFLSREAEKTLRRSAGLSVPQSAYDGSRLAIPCPGTGPLRHRSPPAPLAAHSGPAVKSSPSSRRKKRLRGAPSCVSASEESLTAAAVMPGVGTPLLAGRRAAASKPASLPATAPSPRLAAPPPMPSSLAPARCSEATHDELEDRLRFFARQIKTFRKTSLLYSSPELMERIRQMEEDYGTADSRELLLHLLSFLWGVLTELKPDKHHDTPQPDTPQPDTPQPDTPQPDPESALTSSTRRRGRHKRDAPAHATEGLGDASAPAHATEGLGDASAPAHVSEGPADTSAPSLQGFSGKLVLVLASEQCDEGFEEEALPDPVSGEFKEQFVLVLASEPRDEGFEEEALSDPVPEDFKEQLVLVLASEPRDEGLPGAASASEGSPGAASASEGSPGAASASEGSPGAASASEGSPGAASASEGSPGSASASEGSPGSASASEGSPGSASASEGSPGSASASEGSPGLRRCPPEPCACWGRPPGRPPELCPCFGPSCQGPRRQPCLGCFLDSCGRLRKNFAPACFSSSARIRCAFNINPVYRSSGSGKQHGSLSISVGLGPDFF